jgi:DNA polymerase-3 subunit alpha
MYKFADYGFNKSHAAAYCVVAAHTAWLKNYYPAEFFAALLSTEMSDTDKVVKYSKDAQRHGLEVVPPHVNYSDYQFAVHGTKIYFGLGAIKGVGHAAVESIVECREQLPSKKYESLEEFFEVVDLRKINKKVIECLIKGGALDQFGPHRAQLLAQYSKFIDRADRKKKESEFGQVSLFEMIGETSEEKVVLDPIKPWGRLGRLALEKEVLGFYLSDHPLQGSASLSALWQTCEIANLVSYWERRGEISPPSPPEGVRQKDFGKPRVMLSGIMSEFRELITKKGTRMAFGRLEDLSGSVELVIFPDVYAKTEPFFKEERPLLLGGLLEVENQGAKVIVDTVTTLEEMLMKILFKRNALNLLFRASRSLSKIKRVCNLAKILK